MKNSKIRLMCLSGIFIAIVFVFTAYLHIPSHTGYTHIGDGFIYLAACMMPLPYAVSVGAVGAMLADCLSGYALWAPGSVIIKALTVFCFSRKGKKIVNLRNLLGLLPAWILCIGGYYLYESIITGNFIAPLSGIPGYITQSVLSSIVFVAAGLALDKFNIKEHISLGGNCL